MKKLLFGFVVLFGLSVNAKEVVTNQNVTENITVVSKKSNPEDLLKIKIHIEFGRKSKDCMGFGICVLDGEIEINSPISFFGTVNKDKLSLEVTNDGLERLNKVFGGQIIIVEEDFVLSDQMCKDIGLANGYTIKAGRYSVVKNSLGSYNVIL